MTDIQLLSFILLGIIVGGAVATVLARIRQAKANDGVVSDAEKFGIGLTFRKEGLKIVKAATKIKEEQKKGDQFLEEYVVNELNKMIDNSTVLLEEEKEFLKESDISELAKSLIGLFNRTSSNEEEKVEPTTEHIVNDLVNSKQTNIDKIVNNISNNK